MSLLNLAWRFVAAVTCVVSAPAVMAEVFHPFADPLEFDPDWQFFAPVDVDSMMEMSPRKRAHVGWFGSYDRTYLWMSRPENEQSHASGDFGYGNRFDIGFMREDRGGWLLSFRSMGGPNVYDRTYAERIDRFNANDVNDPINTPVQPFLDANDPQMGTRAYILGDSLNVGGLTSFEINKTWRRQPYRYGGIIEPMVGLKYTTFKDLAMNQTYNRSVGLITTPGGVTASTQVETLISQETNTRNQMVGGQLGARYFTHYERWTLSGELRAFGLSNFQQNEFRQSTFITEYAGGPSIGGTVDATDYVSGSGLVHTSNTEFVFGFEARAEAAYQVTKYFNIRGGIEVIDFAQGIWRGATPLGGNDPNINDQALLLAGFTFGIEINR
jgi:hypothetical protein